MKTVKGILGILGCGLNIPVCSDRRLDSKGNLEVASTEPVGHGAPGKPDSTLSGKDAVELLPIATDWVISRSPKQLLCSLCCMVV